MLGWWERLVRMIVLVGCWVVVMKRISTSDAKIYSRSALKTNSNLVFIKMS